MTILRKKSQLVCEYAKSNRASCRQCGSKIDKGVLRIGVDNPVDPNAEEDPKATVLSIASLATAWHHLGCFGKLKSQKWFKDNLQAAETVVGFKQLKTPDKKRLVTFFAQIAGGSTGKASKDGKKGAAAAGVKKHKLKGDKGRASSSGSSSSSSGRVLTEEDLGSGDSRGVLTKPQFTKIVRLKKELVSRGNAQLKAMLCKNKMLMSGRKDELVERIAEGQVLGAIPTCPKCGKGKLRWDRMTGEYKCPGYLDEVDGVRIIKRCGFKSKTVKRKAWKEVKAGKA